LDYALILLQRALQRIQLIKVINSFENWPQEKEIQHN
jgi:hypothetical protein